MGNKEIQGEYQQIGSEKSVESYSHESPAPAHSQIRYEFSDSATAKPAAKPSGAYNATYNAAKNAAKVVSEEGFSLMDYVDVKPHHKELEDRLLPMFFTEMGDTSELYHLTVTETAADEVSGGQEDVLECHNKNSVGLEQYEFCGSTPDTDHITDVQLRPCCEDVYLVLFCERCSKLVDDNQLCPDCKGPISIRHFQR